MSTVNAVVDAAERRQALDPTGSFICEAPAGSGKTELLTQRFLTLLARVRQPEEILAITFTRKAAGEMRNRILLALANAAANDQAPASAHERQTWQLAREVLQRDAEEHWQILTSPNRLQIKTFDSLCASLANSLPFYSSFAAPPQVTEDIDELYTQAVRSFIASLEEDRPWSAAIATVLSHLDNNIQRLEPLLMRMLGQREAWLPLLGSGVGDREHALAVLEHNLQCAREETIAKLVASIPDSYGEQWVQLAAFAASNMRRENKRGDVLHCLDMDVLSQGLPTADEEGEQQWRGLLSVVLKKDGGWRKTLDARAGFPPGADKEEKARFKEKKAQCLQLIACLQERPGLLALMQEILTLPSAHYEGDQRELLNALLDVLPILGAYLGITFQEKNQVDFAEVSIKAEQALGSLQAPSELAMAMDYRIQHILVDEFQDTSPAQVSMLTALTAGWEVGDGRTLFCVGDAMQSIYGFRDANVGLFLRCIDVGLGDIPLQHLRLSANFRSQAGVIDWINTVFAKAFPQQNDIAAAAVCYAPSAPIRDTLDGQPVQVHGFVDDEDGLAEAQEVVSIIRETRATNPAASVAILVRNRAHASHITPLLREAGFNYRAVDLEPLADNSQIQDLMALTHALLRPADRIAWLSVLRAPWCGLSLADMDIVANAGGENRRFMTVLQQLSLVMAGLEPESELPVSDKANTDETGQVDLFASMAIPTHEAVQQHFGLQGISQEGLARLQRVVPVLEKAVAQAQRKSLRQWVEGTWLSLGGPACDGDGSSLKGEASSLRDGEASSLKNAELFFSLLESLDEHSVLRKRDTLEKAVRRLYSAPDANSDDKLQIMTIHKAKGLEFDTVIVPSLHRNPRRQDPELLRWYERLSETGEAQLLMAPITASGKEKDAVYRHLAELEKRRDQHESCRLLYVACTRAREYLHLMAKVQRDKNDAPKAPAKASLLATVWDAVGMQVRLHDKCDSDQNAPEPLEDTEAPDAVAPPRYIRRLVKNWQLPSLPSGKLLAEYVPYFDHGNAPTNDGNWKNATPRHIGTLVHRILQSLDDNTLRAWQGGVPDIVLRSWHSQLQSLGVAKHELSAAHDKVRHTLEHVLANEAIRWLFATHYPVRRTEYALSSLQGDTEQHSVLDLFIYDGQTAWVVDYKTSQPEAQEDRRDFLLREKHTYQKAMYRYRALVEKLGYSQVRLALYFPIVDAWVEYEAIGDLCELES